MNVKLYFVLLSILSTASTQIKAQEDVLEPPTSLSNFYSLDYIQEVQERLIPENLRRMSWFMVFGASDSEGLLGNEWVIFAPYKNDNKKKFISMEKQTDVCIDVVLKQSTQSISSILGGYEKDKRLVNTTHRCVLKDLIGKYYYFMRQMVADSGYQQPVSDSHKPQITTGEVPLMTFLVFSPSNNGMLEARTKINVKTKRVKALIEITNLLKEYVISGNNEELENAFAELNSILGSGEG